MKLSSIPPSFNKKTSHDRELPGWRVKSQENLLDLAIQSKMPAVVASRSEFNKNLVYPHWKLTKGTTYENANGKRLLEGKRLERARNSFSLSGLFKPSDKKIKTFYLVQPTTGEKVKKMTKKIEGVLEKVRNEEVKKDENWERKDWKPVEKAQLVIQRGEEIGCSVDFEYNQSRSETLEKSWRKDEASPGKSSQKSWRKDEASPGKSSQKSWRKDEASPVKSSQKTRWTRTQSLPEFVQLENEDINTLDDYVPLKAAKVKTPTKEKRFKSSKTFEITESEEMFKPHIFYSKKESLKPVNSRSNSSKTSEKTFRHEFSEDMKKSQTDFHPSSKFKGLTVFGAARVLPALNKKPSLVLNDFPKVTEKFDTPENIEKSQESQENNEEYNEEYNEENNEEKIQTNEKNISIEKHSPISEDFRRPSTDLLKEEEKNERQGVILSMSTFKLPLITRQVVYQKSSKEEATCNSDENSENFSNITETPPRPLSLSEFKPFPLETPLIEEHPSIEDIESFSESSKTQQRDLQPKKSSQKHKNPRVQITTKDNPIENPLNFKKTKKKPNDPTGSSSLSHENPDFSADFNKHIPEVSKNDFPSPKEEAPLTRSLRRTKSLAPSRLPVLEKKSQKLTKASESTRTPVPFHKSQTTLLDQDSSPSSPSSLSSQTNLVQNTEEPIVSQSTFDKEPLPKNIENPSKKPSKKKPKGFQQHRRSQILVPVIPRVREDPEPQNFSNFLKVSKNNDLNNALKRNKSQDLRPVSKTQKFEVEGALKKENFLKKSSENKTKVNEPSQAELNDRVQKKVAFTERQARQRASIRVEVRDFMPVRKQAVINDRPKRKLHKKRSTYNSSAGSSDLGFESVESESPVAKDRNYDKILYELNHLEMLKRKQISPTHVEGTQNAPDEDLKKEELEKNESSYDSIDVEKEISDLTRFKHFSVNNLAFNAPILCKFVPKDELQAVADVNDVEINEFNVDHDNLEFYLQKKRFVNEKMLEEMSIQDGFIGKLHILDLEQYPPGELHRLRLKNYEKIRRLKKFLQHKQGSRQADEQKLFFSSVVEEVKKKGFTLKKKVSFQDRVRGHQKNSLSQQDFNQDERVYARIKGFDELPKRADEKKVSALELLKAIRCGMEQLENIYK